MQRHREREREREREEGGGGGGGRERQRETNIKNEIKIVKKGDKVRYGRKYRKASNEKQAQKKVGPKSMNFSFHSEIKFCSRSSLKSKNLICQLRHLQKEIKKNIYTYFF